MSYLVRPYAIFWYEYAGGEESFVHPAASGKNATAPRSFDAEFTTASEVAGTASNELATMCSVYETHNSFVHPVGQ